MSAPIKALPQGEYDTGSGYSSMVGSVSTGKDYDSVLNSNAERKLMLVQNKSGGALTAARGLRFKSGYYGLGVEHATNGDSLAGFSPYLVQGSVTATIPDGAYFQMVVAGPTTVATDGSAISEKDLIEIGSTAGTIKRSATVPATNTEVRGGRAMAAVAARGTGSQKYVRINAKMMF